MRTLEFLNDNPMLGVFWFGSADSPDFSLPLCSSRNSQQRKVFGGNRRPIVEFAVEDKRKHSTQSLFEVCWKFLGLLTFELLRLRMQEEEKQYLGLACSNILAFPLHTADLMFWICPDIALLGSLKRSLLRNSRKRAWASDVSRRFVAESRGQLDTEWHGLSDYGLAMIRDDSRRSWIRICGFVRITPLRNSWWRW